MLDSPAFRIGEVIMLAKQNLATRAQEAEVMFALGDFMVIDCFMSLSPSGNASVLNGFGLDA